MRGTDWRLAARRVTLADASPLPCSARSPSVLMVGAGGAPGPMSSFGIHGNGAMQATQIGFAMGGRVVAAAAGV